MSANQQLSPESYYRFLRQQGCGFFAGIPDSLLKAFCACVKEQAPADRFWIPANEGAAVGLAIGAHLASGTIPVVYLQNSGLGNTLNPLASMADPLVYGIPLLLLIGWRGELCPKTGQQLRDEPQHRLQGRITLDWLRASGIPYEILHCEQNAAHEATARLLHCARVNKQPVAIVVRKNTFRDYSAAQSDGNTASLGREEAIALLLDGLPVGPVVSTTGMISRELFEQRVQRREGHERDFLVVGAMGHASAIAHGIALHRDAPVYCLDGDGSVLMHMGSLALIGQSDRLLRHIVLNNGAHDSVGGQPTVALQLDLPAIARACGYRWAGLARSGAELQNLLPQLLETSGPGLLEIRVRKGARKDLGRPTLSSQQIKAGFQSWLADCVNE